jgi:hypothetical protein
MPRVPPNARRPDAVLQWDEGAEIHFLLVESKQHLDDLDLSIGPALKRFFTGSGDYLGLLNRPAWHQKALMDEEWKVIPEDAGPEVRYWLKNYSQSKVNFWTAFAFALEPEYSPSESFSVTPDVLGRMSKRLKESHLDAILAVGWRGTYHIPHVFPLYSDNFRKITMSARLDDLLKPAKAE